MPADVLPSIPTRGHAYICLPTRSKYKRMGLSWQELHMSFSILLRQAVKTQRPPTAG